MNVKLLKRVRDRIKLRPQQFDMTDWFSPSTNADQTPSHCGTAACIAGWAMTLHQRTTPEKCQAPDSLTFEEYGRQILDLTFHEGQSLFYVGEWPNPYSQQFAAIRDKLRDGDKLTPKQADRLFAKIAVERINHFIKTGE